MIQYDKWSPLKQLTSIVWWFKILELYNMILSRWSCQTILFFFECLKFNYNFKWIVLNFSMIHTRISR